MDSLYPDPREAIPQGKSKSSGLLIRERAATFSRDALFVLSYSALSFPAFGAPLSSVFQMATSSSDFRFRLGTMASG